MTKLAFLRGAPALPTWSAAVCIAVFFAHAASAQVNDIIADPAVQPTVLSTTDQGYRISAGTEIQTYDVLVPDDVSVSRPGGGGSVVSPGIAIDVLDAGFLVKNDGDVGDLVGTVEGIRLRDIGGIANNNVIESVGGSGIFIQRGAVGAGFPPDPNDPTAAPGSGAAILINGEEALTNYSNVVIRSENGIGAEMQGAFLVINRGDIEGGTTGLYLLTRPPAPIPEPSGDIPPFDFSFFDEITNLRRLTNEVVNEGTIDGDVTGIRIVGLATDGSTTDNAPGFAIIDNANNADILSDDGIGIYSGTDNPSGVADSVSDVRVGNAAGGEIRGYVAAVLAVGDGQVTNQGMLSVERPTPIDPLQDRAVVHFRNAETGSPGVTVGYDNVVTNEGTIQFDSGGAVFMARGNDTFANTPTGVISAVAGATVDVPTAVVDLGGGNDTGVNSGIITAPSGWTVVDLGLNDDIFTNSGTLIAGSVLAPSGTALTAGPGNDIVNLQGGSALTGDLLGGPGADQLTLSGAGTVTGETVSFDNVFVNELNPSQPTAWELRGGLASENLIIVDAGALMVRDAVSVGDRLEIHQGGAFSSGGAFTGPAIENQGRIAPGGLDGVSSGAIPAIGALDVSGDYFSDATSELEIQFDATTNDVLSVAGSGSAYEGAVVFLPLGAAQDRAATVFLNHDPADPVNFTFQSTAVLGYGLVLPGDDPGDAIGVGQVGFTVNQSFYSDLVSPNRFSLAQRLDEAKPTATGNLQQALGAIDRLQTAEEVDQAVGLLGPEALGGTPPAAFSTSRRQSAMIARHLAERRSPIRLTLDHPEILQERAPNATLPFIFGLYGVFSNLDSSAGYDGFRALGGGALLGQDFEINDSLVLGAGVGMSYVRVDSDLHSAGSNVITPRFATYLGYQKRGWYVDVIAAYGLSIIGASRTIDDLGLDLTAESDRIAHEFTGYLGTGYDFKVGNWSFGPLAEAQYVGLYDGEISETGAGNLNLHVMPKSNGFGETRFGARVAARFEVEPGLFLTPLLRASWAREWIYQGQILHSEMDGLAGPFDLGTPNPGLDSAVVGVGLKAHLANSIVLEAEYELDVGRTGYITQGFSTLFTIEY